MAVDTNAYGTIAALQALVGDLVASRAFAVGTTPSLSDAESFINERADILNNALLMAGYTVPVAVATDPEAFGLLARANEAGAAADVLGTKPTAFYIDGNGRQQPTGRLLRYERIFNDALDLIRMGGLKAPKSGDTFRVYAGSQENRSTGDTKNPIFTRSKFDYPGSITREG